MITRLKQQLQQIESFRNSHPLTYLKGKKIDLIFQETQIPQPELSTHTQTWKSSGHSVVVPVSSTLGHPSVVVSTQHAPRVSMEARYAPLVPPELLHDMSQAYDQKIDLFGAKGDVTAHHHLNRINDQLDLWEMGHDDVKMRILAQSLSRKVKKWFKALPASSIPNFAAFEGSFLAKWEEKQNLLQLLTQYNNLKRRSNEIVLEFSAIFLKSYESISDEFKPPIGATHLHYAEDFENDITMLLRERRSATLADMMNDAIEVEVNLMSTGKIKLKYEAKKGKDQAPSSQGPDARVDLMLKGMDNLF